MAEAEESVNQEVKKDEDLESLKETAKEKLAEAAINGSGDNNGKMNGHDGNGNTSKEDTTAENTEDEEVLETAEDEEDEIADGEEDEDDEEEDEDDEDDEEEEVQEVKDDDSSDSDIMEVEAEDPLKAKPSMTATEVKKPQVVTIDDPKALQALATSAAKSKANKEKDKVTIIDTSAILAGRSTSGVTITPAASSSSTKNLPSSLASSLAASGVTISSKSIPASSSSSPSSAATPSSEKTTPVPGSNFV